MNNINNFYNGVKDNLIPIVTFGIGTAAITAVGLTAAIMSRSYPLPARPTDLYGSPPVDCSWGEATSVKECDWLQKNTTLVYIQSVTIAIILAGAGLAYLYREPLNRIIRFYEEPILNAARGG